MGYYIEVPKPFNKAAQLANLYGASVIPKPKSFGDVPEGQALICVVHNRAFEGAGFCYSPAEFSRFAFDDGRPRDWLTMDLEKTKKLSGYRP